MLETRQSATYTRCVIVDPVHPSFHYHIQARWLSASAPPPMPLPQRADTAIVISLPALDKLVQLILLRQPLRGTHHHEANPYQCQSDLATDSAEPEEPVEQPSLSGGQSASRRSPS